MFHTIGHCFGPHHRVSFGSVANGTWRPTGQVAGCIAHWCIISFKFCHALAILISHVGPGVAGPLVQGDSSGGPASQVGPGGQSEQAE